MFKQGKLLIGAKYKEIHLPTTKNIDINILKLNKLNYCTHNRKRRY